MREFIQKLSIFEEARIFHLKLWQTPSFLFLLMGIITITITGITYRIANSTDDPAILIASISSVTVVVFIIGVLVVRVISKIIIINNARSEFLSLVSHQLRPPLTGTKYILEIILSEKTGKLQPQQKDLLQQGFDTNEQMLLLVNDLLDISRMAEGDSPFNYEEVQFETLLKEIEEQLTPNALEKKISLNIHLPQDRLPRIPLDPKKIKFVLQNLADNAVKYTPDGGTVTIDVGIENNMLKVSVHDTGIGVPASELEKLFTKFYRASNAVETKKTGTGLGLYIAKNVIDRHHGRIWAESELNKGSTFSFMLPLKLKRNY